MHLAAIQAAHPEADALGPRIELVCYLLDHLADDTRLPSFRQFPEDPIPMRGKKDLSHPVPTGRGECVLAERNGGVGVTLPENDLIVRAGRRSFPGQEVVFGKSKEGVGDTRLAER